MKMLDVKSFQETLHESMCGPASLKMVLEYFGVEKTEQELANLIGTSDLGSDEKGITRAASVLGFETKVENESSLESIEHWLDKDVPVMVNWFTRGRSDYSDSDVADGHYSVVSGIDQTHIYLQDPEIGGIRKIEKNDFLRVWFDFRGEYIQADELIIRQLIAVYS